MAKRVRSDAPRQVREFDRIPASLLNARDADVLVPAHAGKEPQIRLIAFPVSAENVQQSWTEEGVTILGALALFDADEHAFAVDIGDFERDCFLDAQTCAVASHQNGAVLDAGDLLKEVLDLGAAEDDRQV